MTNANPSPRLAIEKLSAISVRDGNKPVLRRVSLTVGTGEVHGLVGESGAGKSTIAKAILGIIPSQVRITAGRIDFEGTDLLPVGSCLGPPTRCHPADLSGGRNPIIHAGFTVGVQDHAHLLQHILVVVDADIVEADGRIDPSFLEPVERQNSAAQTKV